MTVDWNGLLDRQTAAPVVAVGLTEAQRKAIKEVAKFAFAYGKDAVADGLESILAAHPVAGSPVQVPGLGRMTDEDSGFMTLQFVDDDAAQAFMRSYAPSVDVEVMERIDRILTERADSVAGSPAETVDECDECGGVLRVVSSFHHKDWCSLAAEPMPASEAQEDDVKKMNGGQTVPGGIAAITATTDGSHATKTASQWGDAPVPASEAAQPLGYIADDAISMLRAGRAVTINTSPTKSGPWANPIYAAPATPSPKKEG